MMRAMRYPGGKGKTYQHIINLMPPHDVYIETHLGGGSVMRHKAPASRNIGIDIDDRVTAAWAAQARPDLEIVHGRAEDFLAQYAFTGSELVYLDPPYYPSTRRQTRVYRHDYTELDHSRLAELVLKLPCMVILSGYANPLYEEAFRGWSSKTFTAKTHVDVRTETVWFNFEPPVQLHDSRHLGDSFRERQTIQRRMQRLQERIHRMAPLERDAFCRWLYEAYPTSERSPTA